MTRLTIADVVAHVASTKGWTLTEGSFLRHGGFLICPLESMLGLHYQSKALRRGWSYRQFLRFCRAADLPRMSALRRRLLKAAGLEEK